MAAARTLVCSAVLPLALLAASRARAEDAAKEPAHKQEKIEVSRPKDYDERRESTAAKIVAAFGK
jgi:hypothetical protein